MRERKQIQKLANNLLYVVAASFGDFLYGCFEWSHVSVCDEPITQKPLLRARLKLLPAAALAGTAASLPYPQQRLRKSPEAQSFPCSFSIFRLSLFVCHCAAAQLLQSQTKSDKRKNEEMEQVTHFTASCYHRG